MTAQYADITPNSPPPHLILPHIPVCPAPPASTRRVDVADARAAAAARRARGAGVPRGTPYGLILGARALPRSWFVCGEELSY